MFITNVLEASYTNLKQLSFRLYATLDFQL